jgi:hypothetical protein
VYEAEYLPQLVCASKFIDRVITKDVPVPNFIKTDRIVEKTVVKEKYVDKVIIKEIPVQVERVVVKVFQVHFIWESAEILVSQTSDWKGIGGPSLKIHVPCRRCPCSWIRLWTVSCTRRSMSKR